MDKEIKKISESIDRSKTILLPKDLNSDCYAVYSKEEFNNPDEKLIVDGKAYKHRLYLYKKNPKSDSDKILTFIILNPGSVNHNDSDALTENCLDIAGKEYGAIEVFSIFTLRTIDNIDAVSEDAMLDAMRADLSKNDIVLAWGDELKRTEKYSNISDEDLSKLKDDIHHLLNRFALKFGVSRPRIHLMHRKTHHHAHHQNKRTFSQEHHPCCTYYPYPARTFDLALIQSAAACRRVSTVLTTCCGIKADAVPALL